MCYNSIGRYQTGNRKSDSRWQLGSKLLPIVLPHGRQVNAFVRWLLSRAQYETVRIRFRFYSSDEHLPCISPDALFYSLFNIILVTFRWFFLFFFCLNKINIVCSIYTRDGRRHEVPAASPIVLGQRARFFRSQGLMGN